MQSDLWVLHSHTLSTFQWALEFQHEFGGSANIHILNSWMFLIFHYYKISVMNILILTYFSVSFEQIFWQVEFLDQNMYIFKAFDKNCQLLEKLCELQWWTDCFFL